jgi:ATP-dependent Clp protease ATP-binding subunit ClpC
MVQGKLDPVVGRQQQIERVTQILGRRTKNNPCLIGEPGVGKTAIAEGLAQRIASGDVPETIEGKKVLCWKEFFCQRVSSGWMAVV